MPFFRARMKASQRTAPSKRSPSTNNASPATTLSMATGLALAQAMKGKGAVTLMFATHDSARTVFEPDAMTLAATQKLPIVCLVESRFDSSAETHVLPIPSDSHGVGTGYYPKITVDGCDVVAVFRVAQEAIRRARQGHGPAVIECMTSRAQWAALQWHGTAHCARPIAVYGAVSAPQRAMVR